MTKLVEQLKQGADQAWESLSEGWRELGGRASGALTRFQPTIAGSPATRSPAVPEGRLARMTGWAFMATDVFDDADQVIVRIEVPGLRHEDFNVELNGDLLTVPGQKRIDREATARRRRVARCADGGFPSRPNVARC